MTQKITSLACLCLFLASLLPVRVLAATTTPAVLITELQVGVDQPQNEFIELYNPANAAVDVSGWQLQYLSATHNDTDPARPKLITQLAGTIGAQSYALFSYKDYLKNDVDGYFGENDKGLLAKTGGFVRIMQDQTQVDCLSWGRASATVAGCDHVAAANEAEQSIQRPLRNGLYSKDLGVEHLTPMTPTGGGYRAVEQPPTQEPEEPASPNKPEAPLPVAKPCVGIELSELLPNPVGADADHEYIELYNATDVRQTLEGCTLKAGTKQYTFPADQALEPHEYRAIHDDVTGLQLTNTGGEVQLNGVEDSIVQYNTMADGRVVAFIDNAWQTTTVPTPNAANVLSPAGGMGGGNEIGDEEVLPACPAGKYRNPITNRCRNLEAASDELAPCAIGLVRNPTTNRCRNAVAITASATLTPCRSDQQRNPETNRCRSVAVVADTTKPCDPGEERNPDTNRCRKIAALTTAAHSTAPPAVKKKAPLHYAAFAAVGALIVGYGLYEYRQDIGNTWSRLRQRGTSKASKG